MKPAFIVTLNGRRIHAHSQITLPARLRRYLDEIDQRMDSGVQLAELWLVSPSQFQRLQYISLRLFDEIENNNTNQIEVLSAYLKSRQQKLEELRFTQQDDLFNLEIINSSET